MKLIRPTIAWIGLRQIALDTDILRERVYMLVGLTADFSLPREQSAGSPKLVCGVRLGLLTIS